jgi:hypothetical protein
VALDGGAVQAEPVFAESFPCRLDGLVKLVVAELNEALDLGDGTTAGHQPEGLRATKVCSDVKCVFYGFDWVHKRLLKKRKPRVRAVFRISSF